MPKFNPAQIILLIAFLATLAARVVLAWHGSDTSLESNLAYGEIGALAGITIPTINSGGGAVSVVHESPAESD